jgi:hypothetical protein
VTMTTQYQRDLLARINGLGVIVFPADQARTQWILWVVDASEHRLLRAEGFESADAAVDAGRAWIMDNRAGAVPVVLA